ncbi:MAG: glycosyltransferase [Fimbriimonadaceae bacterium]
MRVLHIIDTLRGGGVETLLLNIVPHVHEQGIELAVMHLHNEPDMVPLFVSHGVPVVGICKDRFRYFRRDRKDWVEQIDKAMAFASEFRPDVIHAHLECSYVFAPIIADKLGVPVVHTVHTARAPWQTSTQFRVALLRKIILRRFKQAARVVCVGEGARQYLAQLVPRMAREIAVVENCVADVYTRPLPATKRFDFDIVMVGRLSPEKNHALALRAFARLREIKPGLKVGIVGFGVEEDAIRSLRDELAMGLSVELLGRKSAEQICDVLDRSRVYHMPSQFEGFGISAAEALYRGLPSVLNDIPVLSQLFGRLPGVWLAKDEDIDDHAEKLSLALDDSSVHDHRDYLKLFTASHHVALLRAVYDEAIESAHH